MVEKELTLIAFYVETRCGCIAAVKAVNKEGVLSVLPDGVKPIVIRNLQVEDFRFCSKFL